jgi:hypothetical protein
VTPTEDPALDPASALRARLAAVSKRALWARVGALWGALGAAAIAAAFALRAIEARTGLGGPWAWGGLGLAFVGAAVAAYRVVRRRLDARAAARIVERAQPALAGLLLTAVDRIDGRAEGAERRLGYLEARVVSEALARGDAAPWTAAVPGRRVFAGSLAAGAGVGLFLSLLLPELAPGLSSFLPDPAGIEVTPGDAEAERGTTLLVLARFPGAVPSRATLVVRRAGKPVERIEMTRNLEDPVFGAMTPPLAADRVEYFVEHAGGRSRRYRVTVYDLPEVERVDVRVAYPRQPGAPEAAHRDVRHVAVARGARVTVEVHLLRPASAVRLAGAGAPPVRLEAADRKGRLFRGVVEPDRTRPYEIAIADPAGRPARDAPRLTLEVHENAPARVALTFPGRDARVSALEEVSIEAKITDDVGVVAWGLAYRLGAEEKELPLGRPAAAPREATAKHLLALEALGARPGDVLTYHVWADDAGPDGKVRRARSDLRFLDVRPFEERFREGAGGGDQSGAAGGGGPGGELSRAQKDVINATWTVERRAAEGADVAADRGVVQGGQAEVRQRAEGLRAELRDPRALAALDAAIEAMKRAEAALPRSLAEALVAEQEAYARLRAMEPDERNVTRRRNEGGGEEGGERTNEEGLADLELGDDDTRYETRRQASATPETPAQRERELASRLKDLARRQDAITDKLRELQLALQAAKEEERPELERRLKRLRDEQRELLDEVDEAGRRAAEGGAQAAGGARAGEARRAMDEARARGQEAAEAMARGDTGRAVGASARAGRQLGDLQQQLQKQGAKAFTEELRRMREAARGLAEGQRAIAAGLGAAGGRGDAGAAAAQAGAPGPTEARRLARAMRDQKEKASALLEEMQKVSAAAEGAEPLVARKLYDSLRRARNGELVRALDVGGQLLERNLLPQAREVEARAREGIAALAEGIDDAARGVLGDDAEALRLARAELDALVDELRREGARGGQPGAQGPGQPGAQASDRSGAQAPGEPGAPPQPGGAQGQGRGQGGTPPPGGGQGQAQAQGQAQDRREGAPAGGRPETGGGGQPGGAQAASPGGRRAGAPGPDEGGGGAGEEGPLTGEGFRRWADRLRDVEDALGDPRMRAQAARVRDRARALRGEYKRHAQVPNRQLVEQQLMAPLLELRAQVAEELRRAEPDGKAVPLDRDPVPPRFDEAVRKYYESLAKGK